MARPFFRYGAWDVVPALCGVGIVVLHAWAFTCHAAFPLWLTALVFAALTSAYVWNLQCISHNFIHNPFFSNAWLNRAYGLLETIAIGVPHLIYHHYHMNHHAGDNDRKGPDGTTRDWSSIYRYSRDDQAEPFWSYCLLGLYRAELAPPIRRVWAHGPAQVAQLAAECGVLAAFWGTMLVMDWRYFVFLYLPSWYLGWTLSYAEGYLEHHGCQPGNHLANSVSSYNWLYNLLWFNNGYHQEHHWDPKRHWTQMPQLHEEIAPRLRANRTRILKGPHLTGFIEEWLTGGPPILPQRDQRTAA